MSTRVTKLTAKSKQTIHVALALDSSGSMSGIQRETCRAGDEIIRGIREEAAKTGIDTFLTLLTFDDAVDVKLRAEPIQDVKSMSSYYKLGGMTALLDGAYTAIEELEKHDKNAQTSFLVYVVTDGGENNSRRKSRNELVDRMLKLRMTDRWTFGWQMPPGGKQYALNLGIDADHIREWEGTAKGIAQTAQVTNSATANYFQTKSKGGSTAKVSNLFTTDLSKLSAKVLHTKLDDISNHFKEYEVKDESRIDEFTMKKTKKEYVYGQTFYQLMKTETIQASKKVLIQEKGKGAIWGGDQARDLIGLPKASSGVSIKVKPGNHANYDVYVQSGSPNRKLPRGTRVLIDPNMQAGIEPTWDVTAVATPASIK